MVPSNSRDANPTGSETTNCHLTESFEERFVDAATKSRSPSRWPASDPEQNRPAQHSRSDPDVSLREKAEFAPEEWVTRRHAAGWVAIIVITILLALVAYTGYLIYRMFHGFFDLPPLEQGP